MKIQVVLDLKHSIQKYFLVTYKISQLDHKSLVLAFPIWSPGSYLVREYQNQVEAFAVKGSGGHALKWDKIDKCRWSIQTGGAKSITVTYKVFANDLNVRGVYADHEMAFFNPTALFFHVEDKLTLPVNLKIKHASSWKLASSAKIRQGEFHFSNFDEFYDTPVLCAKELTVKTFKCQKTKYKMAFWGHHCGDLDQIVKDTKDVVSKENKLFRGNPCREYLFQVLFVPKSYGGLEHSDSSSNIFDGDLLRTKKEYLRFISLLAHEHFHLWNVKRIRPVGLGPFDYTKEVYTKDLWIAEGITSYYDDHFLLRAGMYSVDSYLSLLSDNITRFMSGKSRLVNSVSESSFDAWVRFYRQNENAINTVVSYYLKGGLVSMLLDFEIIKASRGKKTLDDVMRKLFLQYKNRPELGITRDEFFEHVSALAEVNVKAFVKNHIDGVKAINWKKEFDAFGIDVSRKRNASKQLGVVLKEQDGKVLIHAISEDSPAYHSILQPKDEIIAINTRRVGSVKDLDQHLADDKINVLLCRMGKVIETEFPLDQPGRESFVLHLKKKMTVTQKRNLKLFLRTSS